MRRSKRTAVVKGKQHKASNIVQDSSDEEPVSQQQKHNVASSPSKSELLKRKNDVNLEFWKNLGHRHTHLDLRKQNQSNIPAKSSKKHEDHGGIKEKYRLQTNPSSKRVLLIQYPDRDAAELYRAERGQKPLEVRIKPKAGVIEVDLPLPPYQWYDKEKGVEYGSALRRSKATQKNGAYGLAGGLGVGANRPSIRDDAFVTDGPSKASILENFEASVKVGHVMDRITLGGRIVPFNEGDPIYMVATFLGTTCTWTKLDAIVQLRTQFNHLDALNDEEKRIAVSLKRNLADKAKEDQAQDVNMIIKSSDDNESGDMYGGMNDTLRLLQAMRDEPWQRLEWVDSADEASYEAYDEVLTAPSPEKAPYLVSKMTNEQYLDAISCPRVDPITQGKKVARSLGCLDLSSDSTAQQSAAEDDEDDAGAGAEDATSDSDVPQSRSAYVTMPKGAIQPDGETERCIEQVCRIICTAPASASARLQHQLRDNFKGKPRYAFLHPKDKFHPYFNWRLDHNRAGDGISPVYDYGPGTKGERGGET